MVNDYGMSGPPSGGGNSFRFKPGLPGANQSGMQTAGGMGLTPQMQQLVQGLKQGGQGIQGRGFGKGTANAPGQTGQMPGMGQGNMGMGGGIVNGQYQANTSPVPFGSRNGGFMRGGPAVQMPPAIRMNPNGGGMQTGRATGGWQNTNQNTGITGGVLGGIMPQMPSMQLPNSYQGGDQSWQSGGQIYSGMTGKPMGPVGGNIGDFLKMMGPGNPNPYGTDPWMQWQNQNRPQGSLTTYSRNPQTGQMEVAV